MPYPSTIAGAVRTLAGTDPATGRFDTARIAEVKQIAVRGPLLVELDDDDKVLEWYFPAPADAVLLQQEDLVMRYSLAPLDLPGGTHTNLDGLAPIGPAVNVKGKPASDSPRYWRGKEYNAWLTAPSDGQVQVDKLGIKGPERETRTHVSITPDTQTALPGALFQTSAMEFVHVERDRNDVLKKTHLLGLALETDVALQATMGFVGGERRVARLEKSESQLPTCPAAVKRAIVADGHCRLILVTPAYFENGYLPTRLASAYGVKIAVQAAAVQRYQTISGWDYEISKPKPTRRLAPASSVYFLKLEGDKRSLENFVDAVWLNPISDDEQACRDGFGLAALGVWDGSLRAMEVTT
jgi:CRISPR-associated protein Cmr3